MSLEKRIAMGMFAAVNLASCTHKNNITTLGGVGIAEASTDNKGKAYFNEDGTDEKVEVEVTIAGSDFPIANANVVYFDNPDFKGFLIAHPAFQPQLNIALHNSEHLYSLTPSPLQIAHNKATPAKEQSQPGAEKYLSWAEANWIHTGCLNRENMVTLMKPGAYLMKKLGIVETLGFSEEKFDKGVQYVKDNIPESAVAEMYVFIPSQHGLIGTTTITALEIKVGGKCADDPLPNQNGNNSTAKDTDQSKADCGNLLFCDYFKGTSLNTNKWNIINDKGIIAYGGWLSLNQGSSIAAQKGFGTSCADKSVTLTAIVDGGNISLGNGIDFYAVNNIGKLVCGNVSKNFTIYSGADSTYLLKKKQGVLSAYLNGKMQTNIPCNQNIGSLQLTSGLIDIVEVDSVEVKCE